MLEQKVFRKEDFLSLPVFSDNCYLLVLTRIFQGFLVLLVFSSLLANWKLYSLTASVTSGLLSQGYPLCSAKEHPFKAGCPQHTGKNDALGEGKRQKNKLSSIISPMGS